MKVPEFMLSWSEWRHGDGPFTPHPVFPDGLYWHRLASGIWVVKDIDGIVIKESDWLKAKGLGKVGDFNSIEDTQPTQSPVHVLHLIGEWPKAMPPQCELQLIKNCEWKYIHGEWVLFDKFSDREFHEGHWLNYHENLKKRDNQPLDPATAKQATPKGSGNPILGMVLADLTNRALEGKEKYGEPLLAHNGRNPLWDAYQEALDLTMYLRQAIEEQKQ